MMARQDVRMCGSTAFLIRHKQLTIDDVSIHMGVSPNVTYTRLTFLYYEEVLIKQDRGRKEGGLQMCVDGWREGGFPLVVLTFQILEETGFDRYIT